MSSLDMLLSAIRRWISSVTDSKDVIFDCWSPTREWRTKISRTQNKNAENKVIIVTKSAANIHRGKTTTWFWLFCIMMALEVLLLSKKPTLQCLQSQRLNFFFLRTRSHVICIAIQSPISDCRHQTSCRSLISLIVSVCIIENCGFKQRLRLQKHSLKHQEFSLLLPSRLSLPVACSHIL